MRTITAEALERSIAHWKRMAAAETINDLAGEEPVAADCALCQTFADCEGCPVAIESDLIRCNGTPYGLAASAFDEWERASRQGWFARRFLGGDGLIDAARRYWRAAAAKEIAYLESLREPTA